MSFVKHFQQDGGCLRFTTYFISWKHTQEFRLGNDRPVPGRNRKVCIKSTSKTGRLYHSTPFGSNGTEGKYIFVAYTVIKLILGDGRDGKIAQQVSQVNRGDVAAATR